MENSKISKFIKKIESSFKEIQKQYSGLKKEISRLKINRLEDINAKNCIYKLDRLSKINIKFLNNLHGERFNFGINKNEEYIIAPKIDCESFECAARNKTAFFKQDFFQNKIKNSSILGIQNSQKIESFRYIMNDISSHLETNFGNVVERLVFREDVEIEGAMKNKNQGSEELKNDLHETQNQAKELENKVKGHLKELIKFSKEKLLQLKREHISESVLMNFGYEASKYYNYDSILNSLSITKKHITGVNNPGIKKPYSRQINNKEFLKFSEQSNNEFSDFYYCSEKIKFFNEIMVDKKTDFFIDGTRQLISIGTDRRQLLVVNAVVNDKLCSLVYVIMNKYTSEFYYKIFEIIQKQVKIFNYCDTVLIDMEIALIKSLSWLKLNVRICYFHVAYRMIKWKSKKDTNSDNNNYIRPELIRVGQKIIFIPTESLYKYFLIIIYIFVECEKNSFRKKYAIEFIEYIFRFYVKVLGNKRYHFVSSKNLTNNFSESLNAKLKKRVYYKKNIRNVIDFCLINDFEQISIIENNERRKKNKKLVLVKKKIRKRKNKNPKNNLGFHSIVLNQQNGDQSIGKIFTFLFYKIDFEKTEKRLYNLRKMILTLNKNQIENYKILFTNNVYKNSFIEKKILQYNLKNFFETGKFEMVEINKKTIFPNAITDFTDIIINKSAFYSDDPNNNVSEDIKILIEKWDECFESDTDANNVESDSDFELVGDEEC